MVHFQGELSTKHEPSLTSPPLERDFTTLITALCRAVTSRYSVISGLALALPDNHVAVIIRSPTITKVKRHKLSIPFKISRQSLEMRLLHTETRQFGEFFDAEIPTPYYILSHTWTRDELSFKEYSKGRNQESSGYKKVDDFCTLVQGHHGPSWVWVDTICIDKRSSAELTEAINSMWNWYWNAELCYAYLDDVKTSGPNLEADVTVGNDFGLVEELESEIRISK